MVKNNTPKSSSEEEDVDIFDHLGEESPDMLITTEESITVTLFEDDSSAESGDDEDDFETNIFSTKKKAESDDEDNDFDSYFFEE